MWNTRMFKTGHIRVKVDILREWKKTLSSAVDLLYGTADNLQY